jgi:t-SNARE complex subunit (syntaxin)
MNEVLSEMEDTATNSLNILVESGEKIKDLNEKVYDIDDEMDKGKEVITGIEKSNRITKIIIFCTIIVFILIILIILYFIFKPLIDSIIKAISKK